MREAIEKVIAEMERRMGESDEESLDEKTFNVHYRSFMRGAARAFECAKEQLKEVLANESDHPNRADGNGTHDSGHGKEDSI